MSALPEPRPPVVFISHDRNEVALYDHVLELANSLRREGVDARIDLYEMGPAEGWELWRERQLLAADFVVVVCTPSYRRYFEAHDAVTGGLGLEVRWEAGLIRRRLHDEPSFGARVLPVVLDGTSADAVPEVLRGFTRYAFPSDYDALYRRITGQPAQLAPSRAKGESRATTSRPPLGELRRSVDNLAPRSAVFEGREDELEATREALRRSSKLMTPTVLTGMGGVGKARLALEHAYRCEADYDVRWWVRASDLASLQADLVSLGGELGILGQPERVEPSIREVLVWLSTHRRWLVVFDQAEGPAALCKVLPSPFRGHVLITSRANAWRKMGQVVPLLRLSPEASHAVLVQRSGRPDDGYADSVATSLGHLPLALVSAGAYMEATGCSFRDYLERLEQDGLALLDDPKSTPDGDHETVARTWELSLVEIRRRSPAAAALLDWLAFLDPGGVPIPLLSERIIAMPEPLRTCVGSMRALDDAIAALHEFGMIERDDGVLRVHRLVQAVTREKLAPDERPRLALAVVRWVCAIFDYAPNRTRVGDVPPGVAEQVMAVSGIRECAGADGDLLAEILIDVGDYQLARGASHAAHTAYARALELCEACADARQGCARTQRDISIALNRLGNVEARAGNLTAARRCFSRAFEVRKALAYEDPLCPRRQDDLASSLSKLGDVGLHAGDPAAAVELFDRAVELREALMDAAPEDRLARRAFSLSSRKLGKALAELGDVGNAWRALQRALDIANALVDAEPQDPTARRDLAFVLKDLANLPVRDGEHDLAREHLERALAITDALAREDLGNAQAQRDLSMCLLRWGLAEQREGRLEHARRALERALVLRRALASADCRNAQAQRDLAASLFKLGDLEVQAGNVTTGREYHREAADIDAAITLQGSVVPRMTGDWSVPDARSERMLPETDAYHRPVSPWTAWSPATMCAGDELETHEPIEGAPTRYVAAVCCAGELQQLGEAALRLGNVEAARHGFRRMTAITNVLAQVDPDASAQRRAASALFQLGRVERQLGELEPARRRLHRCSRILDSLLLTSPTDAITRRNLAACHRELGTVERALGNLERARESLQRSVTGFEALTADRPRDVSAQRGLGQALAALGELENESRDFEAARELFEWYRDVAYEIRALRPNLTCPEVLDALRLLTEAEVRLGNHPEARNLFHRMLEEEGALSQTDAEDALAALDLVLRHAERSSPAA
jgi:tetratricopeptide (TPR) repeat protein